MTVSIDEGTVVSAARCEVRYQLEERCLVVRVSGRLDTLDALVGFFVGIGAEVRETRARSVLILDSTKSVIPDRQGFEGLVAALADQGLETVPIAFVDVGASGLDRIELGELVARHHGYALRVFDNEKLARIWLRYGRE